MSDSLPPAVPLDICLKNIYNPQGVTELEVDIAIKLLQTIINNNGLEKFRSVNSTKVMPRISSRDNLSLFYVLRHAGFYKDQDRLICPTTIPLTTISNVLNQLSETVQYNEKIRNNEISPSASKLHTAINSSESLMSDEVENHSVDQQSSNEPTPQLQSEQIDSPSTKPPQPQQDDPSIIQQSPTQPKAKPSITNMTAEEKKEYVARLMAQRKKA